MRAIHKSVKKKSIISKIVHPGISEIRRCRITHCVLAFLPHMNAADRLYMIDFECLANCYRSTPGWKEAPSQAHIGSAATPTARGRMSETVSRESVSQSAGRGRRARGRNIGELDPRRSPEEGRQMMRLRPEIPAARKRQTPLPRTVD